jgi:DNA-binding NarL/FixJ family response regulator
MEQEMDAIRVLIVDDHPMLRRGLKSLLSVYPDLQVVGEAENGAGALSLAASEKPDVILLDIMMPGPDGIEVLSHLCHAAPENRVIVLTAFNNQEYITSALRAGAHAYLLKSTADEMLVEAIRAVHQGKRLLSPELLDQVLYQFQTLAQTRARSESGLSVEEIQVLNLIATGATNEEIAQQMFWSERTVKRKVEEITGKLHVRNRAQAVAEAIKRGLI